MNSLAGKKILFVITKSNWGGAQAYVYTLAASFKKAGAEVVVALGGTGAVGAPAGLLAARLADAGVQTIFLPAFARDVSIMREFAAFFELLRAIRTERPDVLHLNSSKAGGIGSVAGRIVGVRRIVFTVHGWAHLEPRPFLARSIIWLASWLTARCCHRIIVVSKNDLKNAPVLFSRARMVVIHNGVTHFPLLSRDEARATLATWDDALARFPFWFLVLGELHPNKGLDTLIRAFAGVAKKHEDAALVLIGEGQLLAELTTLVESSGLTGRVFFTGFIASGRGLLNAADVCVLSSRKEGLPLVILEAGLARRPVVATCVGAVPEVIKDGVSGILVAPDNEQELSDALIRIADDHALREKIGHALYARITRDFSEEAMIEETADAYAPGRERSPLAAEKAEPVSHPDIRSHLRRVTRRGRGAQAK